MMQVSHLPLQDALLFRCFQTCLPKRCQPCTMCLYHHFGLGRYVVKKYNPIYKVNNVCLLYWSPSLFSIIYWPVIKGAPALSFSVQTTSIDFLKMAKLVVRCIKVQPWHVYIWSDVLSASEHYLFPLFDTLGT
jgi:hypothetical protein